MAKKMVSLLKGPRDDVGEINPVIRSAEIALEVCSSHDHQTEGLTLTLVYLPRLLPSSLSTPPA